MPASSKPRTFKTGEGIPASGIYRVVHSEHRLPHEVTLLKGEVFPRCAKCGEAVIFEVLRQVSGVIDYSNDKIVVYSLPVLEDAV